VSASSSVSEAVAHHQETAFSLVMAEVAILFRSNPAYSPNLLWLFAALLAFNLAYHLALRRRSAAWYVPMISMAVNMVLVTAVLSLSGGPESPFWPMYLMPIFTACLYLDRRHVAFAFCASSGFLASLYLSKDPGSPLRWTLAELTIKLAVLAVSSSVTAQYAFRARASLLQLGETRAELERLASDLQRAEIAPPDPNGGLMRFLSGLVYDLNGRLTVIRGRAELLTDALEAGTPQAEDARSIAEAARALSFLGSDLLRVLKRGEEEVGAFLPAPLLEQVLNLIEYRLRSQRLRLVREIEGDLPAVRVGAPHLQQALLELLEIAIARSSTHGTIAVSADRADGEVRLRLRFEAKDGAAQPAPVPQDRLLEPFGGRVETLGAGAACEYVVHLPVAASVAA
jgi:signal transduction histidine kinase